MQAKRADVMGLNGPHVNRMLRSLREDGLIEISDRRIQLLNRAGLAPLADCTESHLTCLAPDRATAHLEACMARRRSGRFASSSGAATSAATAL